MSEPRPVAELWRAATDLAPETLGGRTLDWSRMPAPFKEYPEAERIALPAPGLHAPGTPGLRDLLASRRSRRDFAARSVPLEQMASLLWACQGVTARHGNHLLRTAPSAGALYPFETYVSLQGVDGVDPCLAHLHVPTFQLEVVRRGNAGRALALACLAQGFVARAAAVFAWTAVLPRCAWKYGDRALRYLGLDLGHVCQNVALAAEELHLGCCPVAAFFDDELNRVLEVDGEAEFAYYLAAVGPLSSP
jgi:SagB-type dehydrogenase family enzyme